MEKSEWTSLTVSLTGGMSDDHVVPAFTSLESAHGLSQALTMVLYFAQTGEIRRRNFKDLDVIVTLKPAQSGSFEFVFEFSQFAPYLMEAYGKGLANASWKLIETVFNRATGLAGSKEIEAAENDGRINTGDLGALVQAVEPSLRRGHSVINHGASNITILVQGDGNVINLDANSKEYMLESIFNDDTRSQRFLVTSFDGRNRTGRLFDLELEQAFTFDLMPDASRESLTVIADAARAYALRIKGKFDEKMEAVCAFTSIDAPDGRQKRLKVYAAAREFDDLEVSSVQIATPQTRILPRQDEDGLDDDLIE
jgi:hypothetical protein